MLTCGKRIPDSEHAVSVSLPTMADVVGYEKQAPSVMRSICSGYPRFVCHWMVQRVQAYLGRGVVAVRDQAAVEQLQRRMGRTFETIAGLPFGAVRLPSSYGAPQMEAIRCFLQHTGLQLSSREAEDFLLQHDLLDQAQPDHVAVVQHPAESIAHYLAGLYRTDMQHVALFPSGMSAFYAIFDAVDRIQRPKGKGVWLQVGWLYLDTSAVLEKYAPATQVFGVGALDMLEAYLLEHHADVAALTTEVMTNPLLQTADILRLSQLCQRYDIPFIVDTSMPTPVNVEVLPYADIVIESLTKFAGGHADVMAGAAIFGAHSRWPVEIQAHMMQSRPYERDLQVLAHHMQDYRERMLAINTNASILWEYFNEHPRVKRVFGAQQTASRAAYDAVRPRAGGYSGVLSVVFDRPLEQIYDRLELLKGPSFGTVFTLCMPYVYLAHFDLVSTAAGRAQLRSYGVDPELLRVSVGLEPVGDIMGAFDAVLTG